MPLTLTAAADDNGRRLDRILRKVLKDTPLSAIHRLLRKGLVRVDGKKAAARRIVLAGETITVFTFSGSGESTLSAAEPGHRIIPAKKTPEIIFEGAGLLVLNKPAGLTVHGKNSLEDEVLSWLEPKRSPSLSFRPGPLHRLDKPSSGIIAFSTNIEGARLFSGLLKERKIRKFYLALIEGIIEQDEIWRDDLKRDRELKKTFAVQRSKPGRLSQSGIEGAAQTAVTRVKALARNGWCTLIFAEIETGRTHQIRAHAAAHGHPLLYDKKYGAKSFPAVTAKDAAKNKRAVPEAQKETFLLHAWRMELPGTSGFPRVLEAPLPEHFREKIRDLFGNTVLDTISKPAPGAD